MSDTENTENKLGKPTSSWATTITKIASGTGLVLSVGSVILGASWLVKTRGTKLNEFVEGKMQERFGRAMTADESKVVDIFKGLLKKAGIGLVGGGALLGIGSGAAWSSASGASRARNYIELQGKLDEKEAGAAKA